MRLIAVAFLALLLSVPAYAESKSRAAIETEALLPEDVTAGIKDMKIPLAIEDDKSAQDKGKRGDGGEEEALTPDEQAALICQTAAIMNKTLGPDYQPGVDVYGRPVAPADVNAEQAFDVPERVDIPVNIDVMKALGIEGNIKPKLDTGAKVGTLTVLKDGTLYYNDKDITNTVEGYCKKHLEKMNPDKKK